MRLIAHRAANSLAALHAAERSGVDVVEADLHLFHGKVEVRHEKTIGPLPILWERWRFVRPFRPRMQFAELLAAVQGDTALLLDLKGPFPKLGRLVSATLDDRPYEAGTTTLCARNWLLLRPASRQPGLRVVTSIKGPLGLALFFALRLRPDGVAIHERLATAARLDRLRRRVPEILVWGATSRDRVAELQRLGVSGCTLDEPLLGEMLETRRVSTAGLA